MKKIHKPYNHSFVIQKSGLVGIFLSSRCKSKQQLNARFDENLRIEIDALRFREILPDKYVQLFNVPAACNGATLKGLTLYNIEDVDDAKEPHSNPQPNDFGRGVEKNYNNVKKMLGI